MPEFFDVSGNNFIGMWPNSAQMPMLLMQYSIFLCSIEISTPMMRRFNIIDLSENYFEGSTPNFACNSVN
jgi:hypothetical protein